MNTSLLLVCNMGAFTPSQREAHILNTTQLMQTIQSIQEIENGYQFTFPNETDAIVKLFEFISNERLCCPFLKFMLTVNSNNDPISLSLTGPTGTQEFLRAEFSGAFDEI
jgi:hypothetical protein